MIALLALALLREKDEFKDLCKKIAEARKDQKFLTADVSSERSSKMEDSSLPSAGKLSWRVAERELLWEETDKYPENAKPVRTLLKGDEATLLHTREKRAEIYKAADHPFMAELIRNGVGEDLKKEWHVEIAARPSDTKLPELTTKDGEKPKTPDAKLPGGRPGPNALADVEAEEGQYYVLLLKSKKEAWKGYVDSVKLFVHKDSFEIRKIILETSVEISVTRLSNWKAVEKMEELTLDLSNVKVERK